MSTSPSTSTSTSTNTQTIGRRGRRPIPLPESPRFGGCISAPFISHKNIPSHFCNRTATWGIRGVGILCNPHFEIYFEEHPELELGDIVRLSDRDCHFGDVKSESRKRK
jgi:hypothetical protein